MPSKPKHVVDSLNWLSGQLRILEFRLRKLENAEDGIVIKDRNLRDPEGGGGDLATEKRQEQTTIQITDVPVVLSIWEHLPVFSWNSEAPVFKPLNSIAAEEEGVNRKTEEDARLDAEEGTCQHAVVARLNDEERARVTNMWSNGLQMWYPSTDGDPSNTTITSNLSANTEERAPFSQPVLQPVSEEVSASVENDANSGLPGESGDMPWPSPILELSPSSSTAHASTFIPEKTSLRPENFQPSLELSEQMAEHARIQNTIRQRRGTYETNKCIAEVDSWEALHSELCIHNPFKKVGGRKGWPFLKLFGEQQGFAVSDDYRGAVLEYVEAETEYLVEVDDIPDIEALRGIVFDAFTERCPRKSSRGHEEN